VLFVFHYFNEELFIGCFTPPRLMNKFIHHEGSKENTVVKEK